MYANFIKADITEALPGLMRSLLDSGEEVGSRNGRVKELTHVGITLTRPWRREILLPERKANIAAQIAETMWVLSGRDDMEFLSKYLPRALDYSDDGKVWRGAYGPRLRQWEAINQDDDNMAVLTHRVDQWAHCLDLLRRDPLTRQAVATIYDPAIDTEPGRDIPCNNWLNFSSRLGYLDLHVAIRSNDLMWGWSGINSFEWSAMLEISAALLGLRVGSLHFSTTSLHLYQQHWTKGEKIADDLFNSWSPADLKDSPAFNTNANVGTDLQGFDVLAGEWFRVEAMIRERGALAADEEVRDFPEPMLRSWLRVLQWWWSGDHFYLKDLAGTRLEYATHVSVQPPSRKAEPVARANYCAACGAHKNSHWPGGSRFAMCTFREATPVPQQEADLALQMFTGGGTHRSASQFIKHTIATHDEKHAAYGDSWKKRGEMLGIMANIARKVDRLGGASTTDETSADTAMDLMVYLAKYRTWLDEQVGGPIFLNWGGTDTTSAANEVLLDVEQRVIQDNGQPVSSRGKEEDWLKESFDVLEQQVMDKRVGRESLVSDMLAVSYGLARRLWDEQPVADVDEYRGADAD